MKVFALPENVQVAIIAYLKKRPFDEVVEGIQALQSLKEIQITQERPATDTLPCPKES